MSELVHLGFFTLRGLPISLTQVEWRAPGWAIQATFRPWADSRELQKVRRDEHLTDKEPCRRISYPTAFLQCLHRLANPTARV